MSDEPCECCGRASPDWAEAESKLTNEAGVKVMQNKQPGQTPYHDWHRTLGPDCLMQDIDCVEYCWRAGSPRPVAVIELSQIRGEPHVPQEYLDSTQTRLTQRDPQALLADLVARALGVRPFFVLFWIDPEANEDSDYSLFYVYGIQSRRWWKMTNEQYRAWIHGLRALAGKSE